MGQKKKKKNCERAQKCIELRIPFQIRFYNATAGYVATIAVLFRSPWTHKAQRGVLLVITVGPYSSVTTRAVVQYIMENVSSGKRNIICVLSFNKRCNTISDP